MQERIPEDIRRKRVRDLTDDELKVVCAAVIASRRWDGKSSKEKKRHAKMMAAARKDTISSERASEIGRLGGISRAVKAGQKLHPKAD